MVCGRITDVALWEALILRGSGLRVLWQHCLSSVNAGVGSCFGNLEPKANILITLISFYELTLGSGFFWQAAKWG
jgi:hypothetical protein